MTDKLKELISKAQETGDFSQHHSLIQFNEGLTLENIIYQLWDDMESEDVAATKLNAIQELLRRIDKWMPENPSIFEEEEECDMIVGMNTAIRMFHRKIKND